MDHLIVVNSDFVLEGDETFVIMLQPTAAASNVLVSTCPQLGEANITIVNDDSKSVFAVCHLMCNIYGMVSAVCTSLVAGCFPHTFTTLFSK